MRTCILIIVPLLLALNQGCCTKRVSVRIRQSDGVVRQRLLAETPLGSSIDDVRAFVGEDLCHKGEIRDYVPFGEQTRVIRVVLGDYAEPAVWFLFQTVVHARWEFDSEEKLEDIKVDRGTIGF